MAMNEKQATVVGPVPALACTIPYLLGMVLIYVGERLVGSPPEIRFLLDGIGLAGILWALLGRIVNVARSSGEVRSVETRILVGYLGGLLALALYAAQVPQVREALFPWLEDPEAVKRARGILQVLWPILWLSSILPVLFMEISFASMRKAPRIERRRVAFSAGSALTIAWVVSTLFVINYLADVHNKKWDLSYMQTALPSEDARNLASNLQEDFEVILFYPDANEVREQLQDYFRDLESRSDRFQVLVYDQALEPQKAKDLGARQNGSIVYRYGDKKEVSTVGLEMDRVRSKLAKLDADFQKSFLKLVSEERVAYFVTGHGERSYDWKNQDDPRAPVKGLKSILRAQNFEVKPLGIGQGLASQVPEDASLLLIIDPTDDFLPEEMRAMERYLDGGGRLIAVLDPENSSNIDGLLELYGVRFVGTPLGNDRYHMRVNHNRSDRYNLFTNRTSSHPSVNTLSRNSTRLAAVLMKTGHLEKSDKKKGDARVVMTLRSMPNTWEGGGEDEESKPGPAKDFDLGAAVTMAVAEQAVEAPDGEKKEMKMLVYADADAFSDKVMGNLGNYYLFDDGLKWMFEDEKILGGVKAEEDVRIMHTKKEDVVWFYTTIFGVPLLVLGVGILYNQLRRIRPYHGKKTRD